MFMLLFWLKEFKNYLFAGTDYANLQIEEGFLPFCRSRQHLQGKVNVTHCSQLVAVALLMPSSHRFYKSAGCILHALTAVKCKMENEFAL